MLSSAANISRKEDTQSSFTTDEGLKLGGESNSEKTLPNV